MNSPTKSVLLSGALTLLLLASVSQTAPAWAQSARDREEKSQKSSPAPSKERDSSSGNRNSSSGNRNDEPARDREERAQSKSPRRDDNDRTSVFYFDNVPYYSNFGYGYGFGYGTSGGNATYVPGRRTASRIVFISDRGGSPDLYVMWENGADFQRLTRTPGIEMSPVVSPLKGRLAFVERGNTGQIIVMNADGAKRTQINLSALAPVRDPVWMADDKRIAFVSERDGNAEIYTVEQNGRNLRRMTNHPAADTQPICSPRGNLMVFVSTRDGKAALYAMNTDGTGEVSRISPVDLPPISDPAYAPDGRSVVFVAGEGTTSDLYQLDMGTGNAVKLTRNMGAVRHPTFGPDGLRIAFSSNRPGYFALFTISAAGMTESPDSAKQITFGPGNDTEPTWW